MHDNGAKVKPWFRGHPSVWAWLLWWSIWWVLGATFVVTVILLLLEVGQ